MVYSWNFLVLDVQKNSAYSVKVLHSTREFQLRKKVNVKEKAYSNVILLPKVKK